MFCKTTIPEWVWGNVTRHKSCFLKWQLQRGRGKMSNLMTGPKHYPRSGCRKLPLNTSPGGFRNHESVAHVFEVGFGRYRDERFSFACKMGDVTIAGAPRYEGRIWLRTLVRTWPGAVAMFRFWGTVVNVKIIIESHWSPFET